VKILVTFAVDAEFAPWRKRRAFSKSIGQRKSPYRNHRTAEYPVYDVALGATDLRVVLTGMGDEAAKRTINALLDEWVPDICISSGLAGSTKAENKVGDVLVAEHVRASQLQHIKDLDPTLVERACTHGAKRVAYFLTSAHFVRKAWDKQIMIGFADAVEMESFQIVSAAISRGIPVAAIRVISDACDEDMPYDFARFVNDEGWPSVTKALGQFARRPLGVFRLSAVVRRARKSAEILADFFERFIPALISEQDVVLSRSASSLS
jgi:nucleoside phosphorylase